jgi:hypothetical protein
MIPGVPQGRMFSLVVVKFWCSQHQSTEAPEHQKLFWRGFCRIRIGISLHRHISSFSVLQLPNFPSLPPLTSTAPFTLWTTKHKHNTILLCHHFLPCSSLPPIFTYSQSQRHVVGRWDLPHLIERNALICLQDSRRMSIGPRPRLWWRLVWTQILLPQF